MRRYGFVPARAGSQRLPGKNLRVLGGHPLLAYAIYAARTSGVCDGGVYVSSEDAVTQAFARQYGAQVIERPVHLASDASPDIEWLRHACETLTLADEDEWIIVRPTNPFRTAETLKRAIIGLAWWLGWDGGWESIRAVQPVREHPNKMWVIGNFAMSPLLGEMLWGGTPAHSAPTQRLQSVYVQNAALDMGRVRNIRQQGTIHGSIIGPFFTTGYEGFDINTADDWAEAQRLVASGAVILPDPSVAVEPLRTVSAVE